MKIEYKDFRTIEGRKIVQITTLDERFYKNADGKVKPSTTWICSYYPKGIAYYKWLAEHGWDEAEALKREAGEKGSKIHQAIDELIKGELVKYDDKFLNTTTGIVEELSVEEWEGIMSFVSWYNETKPEIVANEFITEAPDYAGTVDILYLKDRKYHLLDIKSSQNIWKSHELQVSAYKKSVEAERKIKIEAVEILQVGYRRNKSGYKLTEIPDQYDLFRNVYAVWFDENKDVSPKQKDYPVELKIEKMKEKILKVENFKPIKKPVDKKRKVKITKKIKQNGKTNN